MFDAIEDTPSETLITELKSRGYRVNKIPHVMDHVVLFIMPDNPLVLEGFICNAEDDLIAEEQAEDVYPGCEVVWVEEGDDWYGAMDRYWTEQG
jgi:hypothetical protein